MGASAGEEGRGIMAAKAKRVIETHMKPREAVEACDCGLRGIHAHRQRVCPCRHPVRPRHSGVCVRVRLRDHQKINK